MVSFSSESSALACSSHEPKLIWSSSMKPYKLLAHLGSVFGSPVRYGSKHSSAVPLRYEIIYLTFCRSFIKVLGCILKFMLHEKMKLFSFFGSVPSKRS